MIVFLIGYMGSGKSTVGKSLALSLGMHYVDMDKEIESRTGLSVSQIFEALGEERFRKMERELLSELVLMNQEMIVSTGGGVPCYGDNMDLMNKNGITVYLKMSPAKLAQRLANGKAKRPIIQGMDERQLLEFIETNLKHREHYYERAKMVIDCEGVRDDYILGHVEALLREMNKSVNK